MARQSKRRKGPPQSTTLRQFFFPNATIEKKSRNQSSAARLPQAEVIVISDSDENSPTPKRKERARPDSSAAGLSNMDVRRSKNSNLEGAVSRHSSYVPLKEQTAITTVDTEDEDVFPFGESSTLLRVQSPVRPIQTDIIPTSSFGPPSELLRPSKASSGTLL